MTVTSPAGSTAAGGGLRPGVGRLPSVHRERRPALAALAVLLILGGALVSGLIAYQSGARTDYLVLRHDLAVGQQITENDLDTARISGTGANAIPRSNASMYVGRYMKVGGVAGTLLNRDMTTPDSPMPAGSAVVGVAVQDGQVPGGGVNAGDVVQVLRVQGQAGTGAPDVLVGAARVTRVTNSSGGTAALGNASSGGGAQVVNLVVKGSMAAAVASASVQHQVALVLLPPGTKPDVGGN